MTETDDYRLACLLLADPLMTTAEARSLLGLPPAAPIPSDPAQPPAVDTLRIPAAVCRCAS